MNLKQLLNTSPHSSNFSTVTAGTSVAIKDKAKAAHIISNATSKFELSLHVPYTSKFLTNLGLDSRLELALSMCLDHLQNDKHKPTLIVINITKDCPITPKTKNLINRLCKKITKTKSSIIFTTDDSHLEPVWACIQTLTSNKNTSPN